ncbi:MAG: PhnD/SsuA/transferrin family substrate-binding protein [Thioalkalispiraceae bacterium]|jgi:ABC-type phosphate/phosphonate transport system substrate-binding protein
MKVSRISQWLVLLSAMMFAQGVVAADLVMTAPPREKPEAGKKIYGPVAEHLTKLLGKKVVYEHPKNWLNYQRDMRNDKYDFVFDGPHFISWRMAHHGHDVLVKLPGTLVFHLVTSKTDTEINNTEDLVGKKICGISPPNLSTLSVIAAYPNPVRQPVIVGIKGGMGAVHKNYQAGECRAAVFRRAFFNKKLAKEAREKYKIIYTSTPVPNQGFSVSKRISKREKNLIVQSFTFGDGVKATSGVLRRFGGKAKNFIRAKTEEYQGHNLLLEGVIFGW